MSAAPAPRAPFAKRRILIVDDHPLTRRGLRALIDSAPDLMVCATAANHGESMAAIAASRPDLMILDLSLGDEDGLALLRDIRAGDAALPVLVFTRHDTRARVERAFMAGAGGCVSKAERGETLLLAIRRVLAGEQYVSPKIRAVLAPI